MCTERLRVFRSFPLITPKRPYVAPAIRALLATKNVEVNRLVAEAGLSLLEAGGDLADGVIACEGRWLGGKTFVSFDRAALSLLTAQGDSARLV